MKRTRTKICGIRDLDTALFAAEHGADALGFVFCKTSPRYVKPEIAAAIIAGLPAFVTTVGLFVDSPAKEVAEIAGITGIDLLQFHGSEDQAYCTAFSRPYIKAIRVQSAESIEAALDAYPTASGLLLDAYVKGIAGGTGKQFDWDQIPEGFSQPLILAGGLAPSNVGQAIAKVQPFAVDVSGGVESQKGVKSKSLIQEFLAAVTTAENY